MPEESNTFTIHLEQERDYEFRVKFDWPDVADLRVDEPPPLGSSRGPNAARLVAAAVANCLSASLFFCLRDKFKQRPGPLRAEVTGRLDRTDRGRLRIGGFDVAIHLTDRVDGLAHLDRCAQQFEDFCVVTERIRRGIPVRVRVLDGDGRKMHEAGADQEHAVDVAG
ncbi:MAG: OsmC family protein [Burkholderiales bacterium]|nr:OsmC family protein [Burkholderiales bacterium]